MTHGMQLMFILEIYVYRNISNINNYYNNNMNILYYII